MSNVPGGEHLTGVVWVSNIQVGIIRVDYVLELPCSVVITQSIFS